MSADPIIYCLEHLTDYRQFERLCSDLMSGSGYPNIEPIGGSGDGGRDALHQCSQDGLTIFAYTVRSDWRVKLIQDCRRIEEMGHAPAHVVYVCTSYLSATEKDEIKAHIPKTFGWQLQLFDIERIRVQLAGNLRHLIAQHPAIFCPPWFPQRGGLSISEAADTLVIDHAAADHALATWLNRRLTLAGYSTWCYGSAPLAGENADESVRALIQRRAQQYLPVLSVDAVADRDFMDRCGLAGAIDGRVLPCWSMVMHELLPSRLAQISPARFQDSWITGLQDVLNNLRSRGITPSLDVTQGRRIALRAYMPEAVIRTAPERVFANVFPVTVPNSILVYELTQALPQEAMENLYRTWACSYTDPLKLFAFEPCPTSLPVPTQSRPREYSWKDTDSYDGRPSADVVKDLLRRTLDVACVRAGLQWCSDREVFYFPKPEVGERRVSFTHVDGRDTHVSMTGERQYGWGDRASQFRYQLGPRFRVGQDKTGAWWVTAHIYVRVTDLNGACFQKKDISRRRKAVTKNWWNKEWLARLLGMMQGLRPFGSNAIQIGITRHAVIVSVKPLEWECPVAIDIDAMSRLGDFQEEMSSLRFFDDEDDDESQGAGDQTGQERGQ
jgi:hypothetical protein